MGVYKPRNHSVFTKRHRETNPEKMLRPSVLFKNPDCHLSGRQAKIRQLQDTQKLPERKNSNPCFIGGNLNFFIFPAQ
jgi:hypothetical protein